MKKALASLELAAIVHELQILVKGKISQIYHTEEQFLFQLHAMGKGKQLLRIIPGKLLNLTSRKETSLRPSGLCMLLRKYLDQAFIRNVHQRDSERIVVFELEKAEKYFLIVELFSKGNVVLTDEQLVVLAALDQRVWKDRTIKVGEKYHFLQSGTNWKEISEKELYTCIKKSVKRNVATALATEINLGGLYAEELCKRGNVDKDKSPIDITTSEVKSIWKELRKMLVQIQESNGFIYLDEVTPFALLGREAIKQYHSYNEAIDTINPLSKPSPYEKKIATAVKLISEQEESIQNLQEKMELNKKKGEIIYEKYTSLQRLLDIVKELKHKNTWGEIEQELKKEKKIKGIDLKGKKVTIDL